MYALFEVTMYPLTHNYTEPISAFIERLRESGLDLQVSETSSLIRGDFDQVFDILRREMRNEMQQGRRVSFVMKVLNTESDIGNQT